MTTPSTPPCSPRRLSLLTTAGALAVGLAFGGTSWATFTANDTTQASVTAGDVVLDWASGDDPLLSLGVGPLSPGETTQHLVDLDNLGTVAVTQMQLAYIGAPTPLTDPSDGLQMTLEECSQPWHGIPEATTCPGTLTTLATDRPVTGRTDLTGTGAATTGATSHLRFIFSLPDSSPTTAQNTTATVDFTVLGNQRPGEQR